jgi:hypothetical protein
LFSTIRARASRKHFVLKFQRGSRRKRGVFPVLAGLIMFSIMFTAVFGYYFVTAQYEQVYQNAVKSQASNLQLAKSQSLVIYGTLTSTQIMNVVINNTGSAVSVVAYWIYNGTTGSLIQYENTTTTSKLPINIAMGQSAVYTNTNITVTNLLQQYLIRVVTAQGQVFTGSYPSQQLVTSSINSLVSGGIGSLRMTFSSFSWYSYVTGPGQNPCAGGFFLSYSSQFGCDIEQPPNTYPGDFQQLCSNGQLCGLAIDGSGAYNDNCNSVTTCKLTLSTSKTNDLIILTGDEVSSSVHISSISDSAGLTWHLRKQLSNSGQNSMTEEWYAIAANSLSSDTVTVTYSSKTSGGITAFAISGANTAAPFDPSGPVTSTGSSNSPSVTLSLTNQYEMAIGIASCSSGSSSTISPGNGFFSNNYVQAAGPSNPQCNANYAVPEYGNSITNLNPNPTFTISGRSSVPWSMIGDAIVSAPPKMDIAHPHPGTLVPQGQNSSSICGYCGSMVPLVFSLNITNYDPNQADLVVNSQANLWIVETCDTSTFTNNCPQGNPVYVFYIMDVDPTTGVVTSTSQGSFSPINIPYGTTKTLYFGAATDLSRAPFSSMSLSTDDSLYAGNNLAYYGEFAVFILFSGTRIPPANLYVYGQNVPFQTTVAANNLGWEAQSPILCLSGSPTTFTVQANNSIFSGYSINEISINASALSSLSATAPNGWSYSITNGWITWTNTNSQNLITPGSSLAFTWSGTSPTNPPSPELTFPTLITWNGGGFQNLQSSSACFD